MRWQILTAIMSLAAAVGAASAGPLPDIEPTVLRNIRDIMPDGAPNGIAIAVRMQGQSYFFSYGFADLERQRPVTADTLFNLGSVGKVFDAVLLAEAAKREEVGLDDPVAKHVPELRAGGDIRRVTLGQLATFTSGLLFAQDHPPWPKEFFTQPEFLAALNRWRADSGHEPGKQMIYSHAGYELLHLALQHRFGTPFGELMRARLLAPLGLASTTSPVASSEPDIYPRGEVPPALVARAVQGYSADGYPVGAPGDLQGYYHWLGAGQMYSSARDMAVFLAANLGETPAQPELQDAMRATQRGVFRVDERQVTQAMAWEVHDGDVTIVDKVGGLNNTSAYIGVAPDRKLGVVILESRGSQNAGAAGRGILMELARR